MKNLLATRIGFALGVSLLATACSSTTTQPRKAGSYTAARHMRTGSHVPQPQGVDSANDTAMSAAEMERVGNNQNQATAASFGGGGGGR